MTHALDGAEIKMAVGPGDVGGRGPNVLDQGRFYLAMADMSDGDTFYFVLGLAAGVALLWVVTETIWMRLH